MPFLQASIKRLIFYLLKQFLCLFDPCNLNFGYFGVEVVNFASNLAKVGVIGFLYFSEIGLQVHDASIYLLYFIFNFILDAGEEVF